MGKTSAANLGVLRNRKERGLTLIEVMLAAFVLAVGFAGLAILFTTAAKSAKGTKVDSNSTLVAKLILEQIAAHSPNSSAGNTITILDCANNSLSINTAGAAYPGAGATLNTTAGSPYYGGIDFLNQSYSSVTSGYAATYKDCGTTVGAGSSPVNPTTYDVRWNVITIGSDAAGNPLTRMITVAAKQSGVAGTQLGGSFVTFPANLRAIEGPTQ